MTFTCEIRESENQRIIELLNHIDMDMDIKKYIIQFFNMMDSNMMDSDMMDSNMMDRWIKNHLELEHFV